MMPVAHWVVLVSFLVEENPIGSQLEVNYPLNSNSSKNISCYHNVRLYKCLKAFQYSQLLILLSMRILPNQRYQTDFLALICFPKNFRYSSSNDFFQKGNDQNVMRHHTANANNDQSIHFNSSQVNLYTNYSNL